MLKPEVEHIYRPSLQKSLSRTAGFFFVAGYAMGASFQILANSRCDYGQYLGNRLCVMGLCLQMGRKVLSTVINKVRRESGS